MSALTEKQKSFAVHKAAGLKNREAAIAAGYSSTAAAVTASQLMQRTDIKAAIKAAKKSIPASDRKAVDNEKHDLDMPKSKYTDAKEFLVDAMNHRKLPIALRGDYAKALLPYQHARIGETGKKETAKERAHAVAGTDKGKAKSKFAPKQAPKLHIVGGKG